MMLAAILCLPLLIGALFAAALLAIWRRRREALHAASWGAAFVAIALGWGVILGSFVMLGVARVPGAASSLSWLAAALLLVQGLRQRGRRPDRSGKLGAIWIAIALANALVWDLAPALQELGPPTIALLSVVGLVLAAVAVSPRRALRVRRFDWAAMMLLAGFALANVALVWVALDGAPDPDASAAAMALGGSVVYVALGLGAVLLLNRDLGVALERLARTDPLTGVWNRRGFDEAAPHLLARLRACGSDRAAVAIADIDSFKAINDRYGHTTGDAVLTGFARVLGQAVAPGDLLARLGGEEFALLAVGVDAETLFERVEQARMTISTPNEERLGLPPVTASFGVAQVEPRTLVLRDALERADHALYRAKREGRNRTIMGLPPETVTVAE